MAQPAVRGNAPGPKAHYWRHAAIYFEEMDSIFGGKGLGIKTPFATSVHVHRETTKTSWVGFTIEVPFGPQNEDEGFGCCHEGKFSAILLFSFPGTRNFHNSQETS